jgi:hypothetical protein
MWQTLTIVIARYNESNKLTCELQIFLGLPFAFFRRARQISLVSAAVWPTQERRIETAGVRELLTNFRALPH